ncbi:MAG: tetratricopeptide repeat protein, partial [Planctomycetota bacterium]
MRKSKNLLIVSFLISLITILVYLPALQNDFVNWDDDYYIYENPNIQSLGFKSFKWMFTTFHAANWHPLTWLSHTIDYAIWGLNPMGHHLTNILIHGLNTFLVVVLTILLIRASSEKKSTNGIFLISGITTGMLFGLHPIHVESVVWASERKDVLCAFFFLLSILSYIRYTSALNRKAGLYVSCLVFFMLSLMSKPMAVTLPIVLLILDVYPLRRMKLRNITDSWRVIGEKVPLFVLSGISVVLTIIAQRAAIQSLEYYPLGDRLLVGVRALGFYLFKMVWPSGLVPFYPYPSKISFFHQEFFLSCLTITIITVFSIFTWKKQKVWAAAWGYYVITLLPVLGIIQVGGQAAADRYTYLPSLGPFLILGLGITVLSRKVTREWQCSARRKLLVIMSIIPIAIILSYTTINQIKVWKDELTLWTWELTIFPQSESGYNGLANAYMESGLIDQAIEQLEHALKLNPKFKESYLNLGIAYSLKGNFNAAVESLLTTIRFQPYNSRAHYNLATAYKSLGKIDKAIKHYKTAIDI